MIPSYQVDTGLSLHPYEIMVAGSLAIPGGRKWQMEPMQGAWIPFGFWVWSYGVSFGRSRNFGRTSKKHMELRSLSHGYIWLPWLLGFQACHLDTLLEPFFSLVEIAMEFLSKSDIS
jgi:hypothetical protein